MVDEPMKLVIGISGSPTPTVTWLKDGNPIVGAKISNNDGVAQLEIPRAKRSDTGKYQIKVENQIDFATAEIYVFVYEAPKTDPTRLPASNEFNLMVQVPLRINVGQTTVTGVNEHNPIGRTTVFNNDDLAKLEIPKAERSDTEKKQIKVGNEIDSDTAGIYVFLRDKPGAPGVPKCKTTTEDSITLSWTPPNREGGSPVTRYVLERGEKGDDVWETRSYSVNQVTEFTATSLQEGKEYEFRVAACNNAGTGEFSNYSEPFKVQSPQDTKRNIQDSCIFDGRLILLDRNQIRTLEKSLDKEIGKGRIGTVYRSNNKEIFGITVAVKKIKTEEHANQIRREKIVSRLMNPFLLPLLAVVEKSNEECWFITPYCENGDLYDAIKRGEKEKDNKNNTEEISINNQATRVKILLHIALAIEYIHTEVPNVRGPILHKDIASKNVVLDKYLNARLADFGLAREKDDDMSTLGGRKHYDHPKVGTGCDEDYFDYYNFGVIIREMLTSLGPEGEKNHFLKKMDNDQIEKRLDKNVWKCKETRDKLKELSQKCLKEDVAWKIEDFKSNVVDTLRVMFSEFSCDIFENRGESTCHQCIINPIVSTEKSSLTNDYDNCRQRIQVCMACEKNIFLNPITCYCGAKLKSAIGCNWGALLVAGDDESPDNAAVMKREILELERLVTSQAPRIIGIRQQNVKTVLPSENNIEKMSAWKQIQKHLAAFNKDEEINTLLIYFSCHGESSVEGNMFHLGQKEYISADDFQKELDKLNRINQLIIFLDRCFPPMVKFTDRMFIQINACSDKDAAVLKKEGSWFTKYVIQGLKARSEERKCSKDCQHCVDYWKPKTEYISVFDLFDYVNKHLQRKAPKPHWQGKGVGENIAFFTDEVVEIRFTSKDDKTDARLPLGYLKHFDEVKERLFEAFGVDQRTHDVKIQKETFRQDQPYDDCDTLERVMQAWLQRLPLVVTFSAQSIN
ncbi:uncharacterized protein LOC132747735 isoform X2 [Ruditapes philippinarum]|uniref:uncharacterized protein LOC132747735 isoform X2 n=1 Tax=Ruditapes philippinarum TaxID=129788 RepID=UPI00295A8DC9|nr:uncharacterized protein LOC132747735 isoform X2 [Ruditapes philippinarum]